MVITETRDPFGIVVNERIATEKEIKDSGLFILSNYINDNHEYIKGYIMDSLPPYNFDKHNIIIDPGVCKIDDEGYVRIINLPSITILNCIIDDTSYFKILSKMTGYLSYLKLYKSNHIEYKKFINSDDYITDKKYHNYTYIKDQYCKELVTTKSDLKIIISKFAFRLSCKVNPDKFYGDDLYVTNIPSVLKSFFNLLKSEVDSL